MRRAWRVTSGVGVPAPGISEAEGKENGNGVAARLPPIPIRRAENMKRTITIMACFAIVALPVSAMESSAAPHVEPCVVIILGDSITEQATNETGFVTLLQRSDSMAGTKIIGAGVTGDKMKDGLARLKADVLRHRPHTVVVMLGINDAWEWSVAPDKTKEKADFIENLKSVVNQIRASGARVFVCTPTVLGERESGRNRFDPILEECCTLIRDTARGMSAPLLDMHSVFREYLKKNNPKDQSAGVLTKDGVHLNAKGHRLIADLLKKALQKTRTVEPENPGDKK